MRMRWSGSSGRSFPSDRDSHVFFSWLVTKKEESMEILKTGLKDLPGRIEIYGREYVEDSDFIGKRMVALVEEYNKERKG